MTTMISLFISDKLVDSVIVILINLPYFEHFSFRQAYSSSVAFIGGPMQFSSLRHISQAQKPNSDGDYRTQSFKGTPMGIHEKCMSVPTAHGCSLKLRPWKYDSDKQWDNMSALLQPRRTVVNVWGYRLLVCILQTQWSRSQSVMPQLLKTSEVFFFFLCCSEQRYKTRRNTFVLVAC